MVCVRSLIYAAHIFALALSLTGCAGFAPLSATGTGTDVAARIYLDTIDIGGRLSVRYQQNGKEEALHGNFTWTQIERTVTLTMLSPLGQTLAVIETTPGRSTLKQAGQVPRVAANVDALAADALGWPLPVAGLREWLQGYAIDADGRRIIAAPSGPTAIATRDGWHIHYTSWQDGDPAGPQHTHPKRIDLERSTAQAGNVAIRIVIDNWQVSR
jgi:outer membrane lipoprotein LolB